MNAIAKSNPVLTALLLFVVCLGSVDAVAAKRGLELTMETHAAFFSSETNQQKPIDPQVFVREEGLPAGVGPQNISRDANLRPALVADRPETELFTAKAKPLGFNLGEWLGARGTVVIGADRRTVTVRLQKLRPNGTYSLFQNHFDQQPIGFTPLDGRGRTNSFVAKANGTASIKVKAPRPLTHANAVLLVYHSDGATHGLSRGEIGINAHHQLIARVP